MFIVGGYKSFHRSHVIDISGQKRVCQPIADFPLDFSSTGDFINGSAFVCGGANPLTLRKQCYSYNPTTNKWVKKATMNSRRWCAAGLMYNQTHWWITGDRSSDKSTELYDMNSNKFTKHVDLPASRGGHVLVRVNNTHIMLVGHNKLTNQAWMFNQITEDFTELPNSLEKRIFTQAGLVTFENGTKLVIVAGSYDGKTAEAFDLHQEKWTSAIPDLPVSFQLNEASSLPFGDSFIMVGGRIDDGAQKKIITYDTTKENWTVMEEETDVERFAFVAFFVPDDYVTCR